MSKDERKGFKQSSVLDYMYGRGDIGDMMDRYGIEGAKYGRPSAGFERRSVEQVNDDIAKAMMNDYDTRRAMEAAALAGDKDAAKFAKKGFKGGNIYSAYDKMKQLKKEYVGGGGMRGAKNEAGLTHAIVQADRSKLMEDLQAKTDAAIPDDAPEPTPPQFTITEEQDSANTEARRKRISDYETKRATGGFLGDAGSDYMDKYKFNVKKGLKDAGVDTRGSEAPSFIL